jgi:hypothetical protein
MPNTPVKPKAGTNQFLDCDIYQDREGLFYILVPFTFKWDDVKAVRDLWNEQNNGITGYYTAQYPERCPWISEYHFCIYLRYGY